MFILIKKFMLFPVIMVLLLCVMPVTAFASDTTYEITISPPPISGAPATIRVNDGIGLVAAQAKLNDTGEWLDLPTLIEFGWAHFDLPYSGRIYISLTDEKGNVHVASEQVSMPPSSVPKPPPVEEPQNTKAPDSPAAVTPPPASSSAGNFGATGSVAENITAAGEIREFFTITTDSGGIFFLVVDRPGGDVRLLSAVDERDLADFIDDGQSSSVGSSPPSSVHPAEPSGTDEVSEPEPQPEKRSGVNPIPIILLVLAAGGGAYYWKIVRPKQNADTDDYEDEENPSEAEDLGPDMEFEAEQDEGGEEYTEDDYFDESEDLEPV